MKPPSKWRYIGKDAPITDLDDILTGKAVYGIDARMENQLFAVIARPPVVGGTVKSFDATKAKQIPGVVEVVKIPKFQVRRCFSHSVASPSVPTARGRRGKVATRSRSSGITAATLRTTPIEFAKTLAESANKPGKTVRNLGDALRVHWRSGRRSSRRLLRSALGPRTDGNTVRRGRRQNRRLRQSCLVHDHRRDAESPSGAAGRRPGAGDEERRGDRACHLARFGIRSQKQAGLLCRSGDVVARTRASRACHLDSRGRHSARLLSHDLAHPHRGCPRRQRPADRLAGAGRLSDDWVDIQLHGAKTPAGFEVEMGLQDLPYDVPNLRVEVGEAKAHTRIGWLRSVAHIHQNFAVCSFADEMAHRAGRDPYEF